MVFEGRETWGKGRRQGSCLPLASRLSSPKVSASGLETASHLGTRSGTRRGRGGTLSDSRPLLLPGRCAQGRPEGFLGGSHYLEGSNGRWGRGRWPGPLESRAGLGLHPPLLPIGPPRALLRTSTPQAVAQVPHRLCTSAQRGKARSPLAAWLLGLLRQCDVGTGWALHCPRGSRNLQHTGSCWSPWKAGRLLLRGRWGTAPGLWGSCVWGRPGDSASPGVERSGCQSWLPLLLHLSSQ